MAGDHHAITSLRSDGLQCLQNLIPPHVTGMKDQIRALQSFQGFGTHLAVGVCDYPDLHIYASIKPRAQIHYPHPPAKSRSYPEHAQL